VILLVCTANQCRSPLAAATLRKRLADRDPSVVVESVGLGGDGFPATPPTIDAAAVLGLDLSTHRSRRLDPGLIDRADLVVGMERRHVREVVVLDQRSLARAFTLKELVRRGEEIGPRAATESLAEWGARVHEGRRATDLLGASRDDDVADPTLDPLADYDEMAREVDDLVGRLVDLAFPLRSGAEPPGRR
jgi:protein-tyrosine phosphatase